MAVELAVPHSDGKSAHEAPSAARELVTPDTVVRVLATTIADQLSQPLTALMVTLELWQAGYYADDPPAAIRARLEQAGEELVRRLDLLRRAQRYTPREQAGFVVLDLQRAGTLTEQRPPAAGAAPLTG
jgi:hypothetical protein